MGFAGCKTGRQLGTPRRTVNRRGVLQLPRCLKGQAARGSLRSADLSRSRYWKRTRSRYQCALKLCRRASAVTIEPGPKIYGQPGSGQTSGRARERTATRSSYTGVYAVTLTLVRVTCRRTPPSSLPGVSTGSLGLVEAIAGPTAACRKAGRSCPFGSATLFLQVTGGNPLGFKDSCVHMVRADRSTVRAA